MFENQKGFDQHCTDLPQIYVRLQVGSWVRIELTNVKFAVPPGLQLCDVQVLGALRGTHLSCNLDGNCLEEACRGWVTGGYSLQYDCSSTGWSNLGSAVYGSLATVGSTTYLASEVQEGSDATASTGTTTTALLSALLVGGAVVALALVVAGAYYYRSRKPSWSSVAPAAVGPPQSPPAVAVQSDSPTNKEGELSLPTPDVEWMVETYRATDEDG